MYGYEDEWAPLATMADAHREWHLNAGVPMGQAGCPQDACDPDLGDESWLEPLESDKELLGQLAKAQALAATEYDPCGLCGEPADLEMGEFVQPDGVHVVAHAQCGLDAGLELA